MKLRLQGLVLGVVITAAAVIVVATFSLPFILSARLSDEDRYMQEMADWHWRRGEARSLEAQKALLAELEAIRSPLASVKGMEQHRDYVQTHQLSVLAEEAARGLLDDLTDGFDAAEPDREFTCDDVAGLSEERERLRQATGMNLEWIEQACGVRALARRHLAATRAQARFGWLGDGIDAIATAQADSE